MMVTSTGLVVPGTRHELSDSGQDGDRDAGGGDGAVGAGWV